jgi:IS1 family transposase
MGRNWVHAAVASESRFLIDLRLGPRTLETAALMVATVAACCLGTLPLLLVDGHLPYPAAILQVFGVVKHGRRKGGRGRPKRDRLKPPEGLLVGVVNKMADAAGRVFRVRRHAMFGRLRDVRQRIRELGVGLDVNTAHVERLNGTCRGCVARLARRTRDVSRRRTPLRSSLSLFRDAYNWCRPHGSLPAGVTPAMAAGLATEAWSVQRYVTHPAHDDPLARQIWDERLEQLLTSALATEDRPNALPTS